MRNEGGNNEESKKAKTKKGKIKIMKKANIVRFTLALAFLVASTSLVWSAERPAREATPTIQGVWQVARHQVDCNTGEELSSFPAILTFHSDRTVTGDTGAFVGETNEYGSWQREPGSQNYSFRDMSLGTDENGALAYSATITANVHLTDANSFTYSATIQIFDADGNLIAAFCGRATGTRFQ